MPKVIAVAGKGGVGKTTICGMLVRYLVEEIKDGPVLAVDADPNSNLNELLGVPVRATIGEARELMKKDVPIGMTKNVWFEYKVHEAITEGKGFDLLVMGRPEGPGCYCAANSLAKESIDTLKANYAYVVVDNEAGMEHISRLVTQDIDRLYVVSDATPRGVLTARRILGLIKELSLNIRNVNIIINRLRDETYMSQRGTDDDENNPPSPPFRKGGMGGFSGENDDRLRDTVKQNEVESASTIRNDDVLAKDDIEGKTIFSLSKESAALVDAYEIFRKTLNNEDAR